MVEAAHPSSAQRDNAGTPLRVLGVREAVAIIVGIVIGAGIFKAPSLVAQFTGSPGWMFAAWAFGGLVSLIGALCYAELATAYPHAGGDYHFLLRAYGRRVAFLFAWARFSVITTGSIALLAFVFGDYMSALLRLGPYSEALYAAAAILVLLWVNLRGMRFGAATQSWLTVAEVLGLLLVVVAGLYLLTLTSGVPDTPAAANAASPGGAPGWSAFGLAMVFVLLTYGGWNEAAYLGAELRDVSRNMVRALLISVGLITALYLLVNWAYLYGLGLEGMARSNAVAADLLAVAFGRAGESLVAIMVAVASLTSINATMIVGSRTNFAVGRDWPALAGLGRWDTGRNSPVNALLVQSAFALVLVGLGSATRTGFQTMVDYTAPVFWTFFLLSTIALIVLRRREPEVPRPFRVPLYPLLPLLFAAVCAYMLWSSLAYVRIGALVGVGVLAVGVVLLFVLALRGGARTGGLDTTS
ncbi:MAG: amino acid permease [Burkholderiaceae bacterium]|nr:amino acid permease [Burkholderiaceae bacterium]